MKSDSHPAVSAAAGSRPRAGPSAAPGRRPLRLRRGGRRSERSWLRGGRGGGGVGGVGREEAAGKGSTPLQRLEGAADGPLLQVFSFAEDFRWQDNTVDLRGDAEPRPPRGLPRKLFCQLEAGRPLRKADVRAPRFGADSEICSPRSSGATAPIPITGPVGRRPRVRRRRAVVCCSFLNREAIIKAPDIRSCCTNRVDP